MRERSIIVTGDWHIRKSKDATRVHKTLPKSLPLILMGDLIDTGIDRGMQWNQDNVNLQVGYLQKILKTRRVLGYVLGNHEDRIVEKTGLNPYQSFLGEPKSEYFFITDADKNHLRMVWSLIIQHGSKNVQNPLTQLETLASIHPTADIVALGHDHSLGVWRGMSQWLVRTGHLQPYPGYAKKAILKPKPMGYIKVSLKTGKPEVIVV